MKRVLLLAIILVVLLANLLPAGGDNGQRSLPGAAYAQSVAGAQEAETPAIDFAGVISIPAQFHTPIRQAVAAATLEFARAGELTVSVMEREDGFAHFVLVPTAVVESGWQLPLLEEEIVDILAWEMDDGGWQAYVLGAETASLLRGAIPAEIAELAVPAAPAGTFLFPWSGGNWWLKLGYPGWHGQNAVDFKPADAADLDVLAAGAGTVSQVCNDGYQSILRIDHGDVATRYIHLDAGTIPDGLLLQTVEQGQPLGRLYNGHAFDDGYCTYFPELQFNTHCGCGTVTHLHFESSDTELAIDGYNYTGIAYSSMGTPYLSHNASPYSPYPDARFVSQSGAGTTMVAGKEYDVSLTFQNVGSDAWTTAYRLASQNPAGNVTWNRARVYLAADETVAPGASNRFDFTVTAPKTPGTYNFQWRLLGADGLGIGDYSPNVPVQVVQATPYGFLEEPGEGTFSGLVPIRGWAAVDGSTIAPVEVWVDGIYQGDAVYGGARADAGGNYGFNWEWDASAVAPGAHNVQARAVAATGQSHWLSLASGVSPPVTITVQALPAGEVTFPAPQESLSGTVRVSGSVTVADSEIDRVELYLDDRFQGNATYGTLEDDRFYWDWDTTRAGSGPHTLRVRAIAASGAARRLPAATDGGLTAIPVTVAMATRPGDATGDGHVDGLDYVIWLNHAQKVTNEGPAEGDFNEDGMVDELDYTIWLANYDH